MKKKKQKQKEKQQQQQQKQTKNKIIKMIMCFLVTKYIICGSFQSHKINISK